MHFFLAVVILLKRYLRYLIRAHSHILFFVFLDYRWFDGFNWEGLRSHTKASPLVPQIRDITDTSNFDEYPPDSDGLPPDDTSGWDYDF